MNPFTHVLSDAADGRHSWFAVCDDGLSPRPWRAFCPLAWAAAVHRTI